MVVSFCSFICEGKGMSGVKYGIIQKGPCLRFLETLDDIRDLREGLKRQLGQTMLAIEK